MPADVPLYNSASPAMIQTGEKEQGQISVCDFFGHSGKTGISALEKQFMQYIDLSIEEIQA